MLNKSIPHCAASIFSLNKVGERKATHMHFNSYAKEKIMEVIRVLELVKLKYILNVCISVYAYGINNNIYAVFFLSGLVYWYQYLYLYILSLGACQHSRMHV